MKWLLAAVLFSGIGLCACGAEATNETRFDLGFVTNSGAVFRTWVTHRTNVAPNPRFGYTNHFALSNRVPADVFRKVNERWAREPRFVTNVFSFTNSVFARLLPETLTYRVFTNFIARTNGRTTRIWSRRNHPLLWPMAAPAVEWDRQGLVWGMKGMTALSPCWQGEGAPGQVPVTLLTRRHGYTRGHGMGPEGFVRSFNGKKVWFATRQDKVLEAKVAAAVVRCSDGRDYTLFMFKEDLPDEIEPMSVIDSDAYRRFFPFPQGAPGVTLAVEQTGHTSAPLPGFTLSTYKGGDSGSANMIPFFDELVFIGGRTTSPPSQRMQNDIDELCRQQRVDSGKYQLHWVDLSGYPSY